MSKIDFIKALEMGRDSVPLVGQIALGITIVALAVGVVLEIATDGSIPVYSGIATFLNGTWVTDVVAFFTNLSTGIKIALSLFVLVVIMILFRKYLGSGKEGSGSSM